MTERKCYDALLVHKNMRFYDCFTEIFPLQQGLFKELLDTTWFIILGYILLFAL